MSRILSLTSLVCLAAVPLACGPTTGPGASFADHAAGAQVNDAPAAEVQGDETSRGVGQADDAQAYDAEATEQRSLASEQLGATAAGGALVLKQPGFDGSKLCVDVRDLNRDNGARLQLYGCAGSNNQSFVLKDGLVQVYGNKCLNVKDGKNQDGVAVQIWQCSGADRNMLWDWTQGHLRWRGTDKCLDVANGQFKNGAPLQIWTCNWASKNQTFALGGAAAGSNNAGSPTPVATQQGQKMDVSSWQQEVHPAYRFNNEQQNYTDGGKNVAFAGGVTTISAYPTGGNGWSSARLSGPEMGRLPWYLEADIVSPTGQGTWPAFWLTARGEWPQGGEIDIMEQVNGVNQTHISTHWGQQTGNATFNTHEIINNVNVGQRHRYGVWVTDGGMQFYLDGKPIGKWVTFPGNSNFSTIAAKMVPIVNVAMGGDWPGYAQQWVGTQKMVVYGVVRDTKPPSN